MDEEMEAGYFRGGSGSYPGMTPKELYDAVRGWWVGNPKAVERRRVQHVVAVIEGVTRAIYEIEDFIGPRADGRWGFKGKSIESGRLWEDYVGPWGHRVPFAAYAQNPLIYWPIR